MIKIRLILLLLLITIPAAAVDKAIVEYICDGDTLVVMYKGKSTKVRLIGIDAPESKENSKAIRNAKRSGEDIKKITEQGKRATAFVKSVLKKGDSVTLEFDAGQYDKYGRTLAYVYLEDGRMLNELIIASGYATPMTIAPNVKYEERFLMAYRKAREKKIGLWAE